MPKLSSSLYYPAFALIMLFFVLAFVPRRELQRTFWFSLLWGTGLDTLLILLAKLLNLYHYVHAEPFELFGSPFFINLSWAAAVMLFLHFLPNRKERYVMPLYLASYAWLGVYIGVFLMKAGLIIETHWSEVYRFPLVYGCFYICYKHYQHLKKKDWNSL